MTVCSLHGSQKNFANCGVAEEEIAADETSCLPSNAVPSAPSPAVVATPPSTLQERFAAFVMCAFTPRRPSELPTSQWISFHQLLSLFQPHAPDERWLRLGPGNPILKQLIIQWYKGHPAYVGLAANAWCKKLKSNDPQDGSQVVSFSFEYSPTAAAAAAASVVQPSLEKGGTTRPMGRDPHGFFQGSGM